MHPPVRGSSMEILESSKNLLWSSHAGNRKDKVLFIPGVSAVRELVCSWPDSPMREGAPKGKLSPQPCCGGVRLRWLVRAAAAMEAQQLGCVFSGILGAPSARAPVPGLLRLHYRHSDSLGEATPSRVLFPSRHSPYNRSWNTEGEAKVCRPGFSPEEPLGCGCPGDFHCVTEPGSGAKAGSFQSVTLASHQWVLEG